MSDRNDDLRPDDYLAAEAAATVDDLHGVLSVPTSQPAGPAVLRSTIWTVAGFAAMKAFQLGFNVPLTRLLTQQVYGVTTLVDLFMQGLHMFSDLGVRQCVINSPRGDDREFLNTAWTVQVIRGFVLWALTAAICWPISIWYDIPQMQWLLPLVGISAVLDGFTSTAAMTMSRQLRRDRLVIREVAANVLSMSFVIVTLWIIHHNRGNAAADNSASQMLAFGFGKVLSPAIEMFLSYTLIRGAVNRFSWDRSAARELMHFGGWIFISTACTYLAANGDRLYIGKISLATLASYQLAANFAKTPIQVLTLVAHQVLFPLYSRIRLAGEALTEVVPLMHSAVNGAAAYLVAGAAAACPTFIWLVYDDRYRPAAEYVRWISVAVWFTLLQTSYEVVLLAMGRTRQIATGQILKLISLGPLLWGGYHYHGIVGLIGGYTIAEALRYAVLCYAVGRTGLWIIRIDIMLTALVVLSVGIANLVGPHFATADDPASRQAVRMAVEIVLISGLWGTFLAFWWPRHGRRIIELLWRGK